MPVPDDCDVGVGLSGRPQRKIVLSQEVKGPSLDRARRNLLRAKSVSGRRGSVSLHGHGYEGARPADLENTMRRTGWFRARFTSIVHLPCGQDLSGELPRENQSGFGAKEVL